MTLDELQDAVTELGVEERGALADSIWESFLTPEEKEIQEEWIAEAERRLEAVRSGKVKTIPWEEVREQLRAKYGAPSVPFHVVEAEVHYFNGNLSRRSGAGRDGTRRA